LHFNWRVQSVVNADNYAAGCYHQPAIRLRRPELPFDAIRWKDAIVAALQYHWSRLNASLILVTNITPPSPSAGSWSFFAYVNGRPVSRQHQASSYATTHHCWPPEYRRWSPPIAITSSIVQIRQYATPPARFSNNQY